MISFLQTVVLGISIIKFVFIPSYDPLKLIWKIANRKHLDMSIQIFSRGFIFVKKYRKGMNGMDFNL